MCGRMTLNKMRMALMQTDCWERVAEGFFGINYFFIEYEWIKMHESNTFAELYFC